MRISSLTFPPVRRRALLRLWCFSLLFLASLILPARMTWALTDRLQLPAANSVLASSALLLDVALAGSRLVAVGERGHVIYSDDQGQGWHQAQVPVAVTLTGVSFTDAQHGWAVGHDGVVLATRDGGERWALQLDGNEFNRQLVRYYENLLVRAEAGESELHPDDVAMALDDARFAAEEGPSRPWLDVLFVNAERGWAVGAYGLFASTEDGGLTWRPAALDNPDRFHLNTLAAGNARLLVAGEAGLLLESHDEGASWQRLDASYEGPFFGALVTHESALLTGLRGRLFETGEDQEWVAIEAETRATLNGALSLSDGGVLAFGNGGVLLYRAADAEGFDVYVQPDRRSYLGALEVVPGELLLVGQGGVSRLSLRQMREVGRE